MTLLGNYSVLYKSAGSFRSGGATGQGLDRANSNRNGPSRNRFAGAFDPRTSHPLGTAPGNALVIAQKPGGIGSRNEIVGQGSMTGAGALGINITASLAGAALLDAVGQLVVSGTATINAGASVTASIVGILSAAATLAGSGNMSGAISALANAVATLQGQASSSFTASAIGVMSATIDVAATSELTAAGIADEILDQQMVETGLSVRETLRLCAAALAGKVSISGNTVTIRNAVADDADRITSTTTAEGERTSITYDLG
jgi:hypothetical protein